MNTKFTNDPLQNGKMSNKLIQNLVDNYRKNHLNAINDTLGIQDAHSIWFDLPKLKRFIATIEEEARKINPDTSEEDLGIRFYYAAYPKNENWDVMESHPVPEEYAERHTLVLVPTLKKTSEEGETLDYDFNSLSSKDDSTVALALNARGTKIEDGETIGENQGTLTPPGNPISEKY